MRPRMADAVCLANGFVLPGTSVLASLGIVSLWNNGQLRMPLWISADRQVIGARQPERTTLCAGVSCHHHETAFPLGDCDVAAPTYAVALQTGRRRCHAWTMQGRRR